MKCQDAIDTLAQSAGMIAFERNIRSFCFNDPLFDNPCWNILVECCAAEARDQPLSFDEACRCAQIPLPTAHRWIDVLSSAGWLTIAYAGHVAETVRLTDGARHALGAYGTAERVDA